MTEILADIWGQWYELGLQGVPSSSRIWGPDSFVNSQKTTSAIVSSSPAAASMSAQALVNNTTSPIHSPNGAGFQCTVNGPTDAFTTPLFVVPTPDHPRQPVFVIKSTSTGHKPDAWPSGQIWTPTGSYPGPMQATCLSVPVPLGGDLATCFEDYYGREMAATGSDGHMVIWDPWHDEIWDFEYFRTFHRNRSSLHLSQGVWLPPDGYDSSITADTFYGAIQAGYMGTGTGGGGVAVSKAVPILPQLSDSSFGGAAASGLHLGAGIIMHDDIMRGVIPHALSLAIVCENGHTAPATRQDQAGIGPSNLIQSGATDFTLAIPLGTIFRIDPTWTVPPEGDLISAHSELAQIGLGSNGAQHITKWHRMLWTAMRDYGFYSMDWAGAVAMVTQGGSNLDTPYSPYTWDQLNAQYAALGYVSNPAGALGTAPWSLVQQVVYP